MPRKANRVTLQEIAEAASPLDPAISANKQLHELAVALYRDNYVGPAAGFARYLLDRGTLDHAFELAQAPKKGAPKLRRGDQMRKVFELRLRRPKPTPWKEIAREIDWKGNIDNLRKAYREARDQLMIAELGRRLSGQ